MSLFHVAVECRYGKLDFRAPDSPELAGQMACCKTMETIETNCSDRRKHLLKIYCFSFQDLFLEN